MPLARIELPAGKPAGFRRTIADVVCEAMIAALDDSNGERFRVIAERAPDALFIDPSYLGIERSADALTIQVTLNEGRTVEAKKAFYKAVADGLKVRIGLRGEDMMINLVEVRKENWSLGNVIRNTHSRQDRNKKAMTGAVLCT